VPSRFVPALVAAVGLIGTATVVAQQPAATPAPSACSTTKFSKKLEKPLNAIQKARDARDWEGMLVAVKEAAAVEVEKTDFDQFWLHELGGVAHANLKQYPEAVRELGLANESPCMKEADKPQRAKVLMQLSYQAKDYQKAIEYGNRALQLSPDDAEVTNYLGNSYFQVDDMENTRKVMTDMISKQEAAGKLPEEQAYRILQTACLRMKDDACVVEQIEKLVKGYPKPTYWTDLVNALLRVSRNDRELLNILRLADGVDVMKDPAQYIEMAQLAMGQGLPGEAQAMIEKGVQKGVFSGAREKDQANRLLAEAKTAVNLDKSTLDKQDASARAKPTGDSDVKLGAAYLSYGQTDKAIEALQRGIGKSGVKNPDEAGLLLGIAYLRANNKPEAAKAFQTVSKDPVLTRIAKLWLLNTSAPATAAAAG
jgi:tetratricopeptide (TPR) repeat protein